VPGGVTGDVTGSELAEVCQQGHMSVTGRNRDEGSDRRSRSLVHSSVMGVEDARLTSVERERGGEVGWYENLSRADECS